MRLRDPFREQVILPSCFLRCSHLHAQTLTVLPAEGGPEVLLQTRFSYLPKLESAHLWYVSLPVEATVAVICAPRFPAIVQDERGGVRVPPH